MDVSESLKEIHPQKHYFKIMCRLLYYLGLGDCWYEKTESSVYEKKFYMVWAALSNSYVFLVLFDELFAYFRSDLTEKEKHDLVQFSIAHPLICSKLIVMFLSKARISVVFKRLLEDYRQVFTSIELERACVKRFAIYSVTVFGASYLTLIISALEGIRASIMEGIPIRIEVTFFPSSQAGLFVKILRFFVEFHWWYIVAIMGTIDCLAICSLLTVGLKFKLLQKYFEDLRIKLVKNVERKNQRVLEEDFKKDFVIGVQLHEDALWCARNVQSALGYLYSIQVIECVSLITMCLVKLVSEERNMIYLLANMAFIACLILLTGCYMMAAGDITHEAEIVSTSIFHCGWEAIQEKASIRALVVVALQRSQVPVYMTAFGVFTLSYSNFISVLRSSYSFFAVMY